MVDIYLHDKWIHGQIINVTENKQQFEVWYMDGGSNCKEKIPRFFCIFLFLRFFYFAVIHDYFQMHLSHNAVYMDSNDTNKKKGIISVGTIQNVFRQTKYRRITVGPKFYDFTFL